MIFKYVTDGYRTLVVDKVARVEIAAPYALLTFGAPDGSEPMNSLGETMWHLNMWHKLDYSPGDEALAGFGVPTACEHYELGGGPTVFTQFVPAGQPVAGVAYRLHMEDGTVQMIVCNHRAHAASDSKKHGAFTMTDDGNTVDRRSLNINKATSDSLLKSFGEPSGR